MFLHESLLLKSPSVLEVFEEVQTKSKAALEVSMLEFSNPAVERVCDFSEVSESVCLHTHLSL